MKGKMSCLFRNIQLINTQNVVKIFNLFVIVFITVFFCSYLVVSGQTKWKSHLIIRKY